MRVRALINYKDFQLNKDIVKGEEYEVSKERAEVLLKGNPSSKNKPFVEVVEKSKTIEVETPEIINEDNLETAIVKPKKKKVTKK